MNEDKRQDKKEKKGIQWWQLVVLGISVGLTGYGIYKWAKKEQWKIGEAVASAAGGGSLCLLAGPGLVDKVKTLLKTPPRQQARSDSALAPRPVIRSTAPDWTQAIEKPLCRLENNLQLLRVNLERTTEAKVSNLSVPPAQALTSLAVPAPPSKTDQSHQCCTWFDVFPTGSVTLIIGKPGSGKSALG